MTTAFDPTPEQDEALGLFLSGENLCIRAGAGTGKTSTLRLIAEASPTRRGQYLAFNRSIVEEAGRKMPRTVASKTAHSLAFSAVGRPLAHKLQSRRLPSGQIAGLLGIREPVKVKLGQAARYLAPGWLASHVIRSIAVFCNSADPEPTRRHVPYVEGIDMPDAAGRRTYANNDLVRDAIAPVLKRAWADLIDPNGQLRYSHDVYLKLWELSDPVINADFVMFDEAQDASPVMASIVAQQADRAQLVYVGDSEQAIYAWRGAVDAMDGFDGAEAYLTQSFRFGPAVAEIANRILAKIPASTMRLTGTPTIDSSVGPVDEPDAFLCRTNAVAMRTFLAAIAGGRRPHLIGGGTEIVSFARAWIALRDEGFTPHPELSCFRSIAEVEDYVSADPQGSDLALMFDLMETHGPETLIEALDRQVGEAVADEVISTAHRSKGREWPTVALADDFPEQGTDPSIDELRLLYVAATRAQTGLDIDAVGYLRRPTKIAEA